MFGKAGGYSGFSCCMEIHGFFFAQTNDFEDLHKFSRMLGTGTEKLKKDL